MKILVVQLARLGDVLQTLPTIQSLKKTHPQSEITLLVRNTFSDATLLSPYIDRVIEFSSESILKPALEDSKNKPTSLNLLRAWLESNLLNEEYDLLLNLTFSVASSFLSELIPAKQKKGVHRNSDGQHLVQDSWSQYFFSQIFEKNLNILHLNDIFMRIAETSAYSWPIDLKFPTNISVKPKSVENRIGVQVSASQSKKTLSLESWIKLCSEILSTHQNSELVFFGSTEDLRVIEGLIDSLDTESQSRCINLAGLLKFHENAQWVLSCNWVITPDTSLVHLASLCGTKIIYLPLGDVRAEETGPYGNGHHILYPALSSIEQIALEVSRVIAGLPARKPVAAAVTQLEKCSDGTLRNVIIPQNYVLDEIKNFYMQSYYLLYEFRCSGRVEDIPIPKIGDPSQAGALDHLLSSFDALCSVRRLAEFGQFYCFKMLKNINDPTQLKSLMHSLSEVENLLQDLKKSVFFVKPLIDTWNVAKENITTPDLSELIGYTEAIYRELGQNVDILQQLIQSAVQSAQNNIEQLLPKIQSEITNQTSQQLKEQE